jgi:hypothetical protein
MEHPHQLVLAPQGLGISSVAFRCGNPLERKGLGLYLERPATQWCAFGMLLKGSASDTATGSPLSDQTSMG